ncbi:uncharacterized protein PADG_12254 [Paracoccidioides brasiliensis Pb18]|uniref:Uncharacterized protein n=1 Tax=Paracoccidioides brasiliensis (strain Pb18) TaxID=502780 RepID=A0A0A0HSR2_PARBD|nr:uncharacterized protein PADG_12254 [Paracoccidioides brasiliensis Pb18]KGM91682.1 hypothetical protein PADG_12254 [Paracoccidioides brasiliensis Pb18]
MGRRLSPPGQQVGVGRERDRDREQLPSPRDLRRRDSGEGQQGRDEQRRAGGHGHGHGGLEGYHPSEVAHHPSTLPSFQHMQVQGQSGPPSQTGQGQGQPQQQGPQPGPAMAPIAEGGAHQSGPLPSLQTVATGSGPGPAGPSSAGSGPGSSGVKEDRDRERERGKDGRDQVLGQGSGSVLHEPPARKMDVDEDYDDEGEEGEGREGEREKGTRASPRGGGGRGDAKGERRNAHSVARVAKAGEGLVPPRLSAHGERGVEALVLSGTWEGWVGGWVMPGWIFISHASRQNGRCHIEKPPRVSRLLLDRFSLVGVRTPTRRADGVGWSVHLSFYVAGPASCVSMTASEAQHHKEKKIRREEKNCSASHASPSSTKSSGTTEDQHGHFERASGSVGL